MSPKYDTLNEKDNEFDSLSVIHNNASKIKSLKTELMVAEKDLLIAERDYITTMGIYFNLVNG